MSCPPTPSPARTRAACSFIAATFAGLLAAMGCSDATSDRPFVPNPDVKVPDVITKPDIPVAPDTPGAGCTTCDVTEDATDAGPQPGGLFWPCVSNNDCDSGYCVPTDAKGDASVCTIECITECPEGWNCKATSMGSDIVNICSPYIDTLCATCQSSGDCGAGSNALCLPIEGGHCGRACANDTECPEGYGCDGVADASGVVVAMQCMPTHGSCECPATVDFETDVLNCGGCHTVCAFDHAIAACTAKKCSFDSCEDGWINLDKDTKTGCEYECTAGVGPIDEPDPTGKDLDCDGIDGDLDYAVFVAPDGVDLGNTLGSREFPFKTIKKAAEFAAASKIKTQVLISKGTYVAQVKLLAGISLYGGYDPSAKWKRNPALNETIVRWEAVDKGVVRTVIADNIAAATTVDGITIEAASNPVPSGSSIALHVLNDSSGLRVRGCRLVAGSGGVGVDGKPGGFGQGGDSGSKGTEGIDDSCKPDKLIEGGDGGKNPCSTGAADGGKGGSAGWGAAGSCSFVDTVGCVFSGCDGRRDAGRGADGLGGKNGQGGPGGGPEQVGQPGSPGGEGSPGDDGKGGTRAGNVNADLLWYPTAGGDGKVGSHGTGGGGGGGGGGSDNGAIGDSSSHGGSGGGGGAGGCGGAIGSAALGGGGSIAVMIVNAAPTLIANEIVYRNGGNGGIGGLGGDGGPGGEGRAGGAGWDASAAGGTGGTGGKGGRGGHGGGGAGGPSVGIFISGPGSPVCETNLFTQEGSAGLGGVGGDGSAVVANGEPGLSSAVVNSTLTCVAPP